LTDGIYLKRSVDTAKDYYGVERSRLMRPNLCRELTADVIAAGFELAEEPVFHRFPGGGEGFSMTGILTASGFMVHSAPEKECVEITIHTCEVTGVRSKVEKTPAQKTRALYRIWRERFKPRKVVVHATRFRADRPLIE
jgi:S-adenosylmethionine/arginine decarboxylase-like enzyme